MTLRLSGGQIPTLSIFDRLWDDSPGSSSDPVYSNPGSAVLRKVMQGVCRDLQNLLNTRRDDTHGFQDHPQLQRSLLSYGVVDFTSLKYNMIDQPAKLVAHLKAAIEAFEPRLKKVTVVLERRSEAARFLQFRIEATLHVSAVETSVVHFTAVVDPTTGKQLVGETADA